MPPPWKIYSISPIDSDWSVVPTVREYASQKLSEMHLAAAAVDPRTLREVLSRLDFADPQYELARIIRDLGRVLRAAGSLDEPFRNEPRILWFPEDTEFVYGFVWKIDSNGATFVAVPSPIACPWLAEIAAPDVREVDLEQY